jgi:hypothetical protein
MQAAVMVTNALIEHAIGPQGHQLIEQLENVLENLGTCLGLCLGETVQLF